MLKHIEPGPRMSKAVVAGDTVYISGQLDESGADVAAQTRAVLAKLDELLAQAGSDKSHALMANIWLTDIATFDEMNAVWDAWIDPAAPPARATVEAKLARPKCKVEIALVATLRPRIESAASPR